MAWTWKQSFVPELFIFESIFARLEITTVFDDAGTVALKTLVFQVLYLMHLLLDFVEPSVELVLSRAWHLLFLSRLLFLIHELIIKRNHAFIVSRDVGLLLS